MKDQKFKNPFPVDQNTMKERGMLNMLDIESCLKRNQALSTFETSKRNLQQIQEKTINKLLQSKPQETGFTVQQKKYAEDLDTFPLKGWLTHSSNKDQKVRRHFWKLEDDVITLFLSESESLFYKHIPLSSINQVKALKNGLQLLLMLRNEELIVSPVVKDADRGKKIIKRWKESIKKSTEGTKTCVTTNDVSDHAELENKGIFEDVQLALDLEGYSFNDKKHLRELIIKNGGQISYIITVNTKFLVTCKELKSEQLSSFKCRKAMKLRIPVVGEKFVRDCVEKGALIEVDVSGQEAKENFGKGKISLPDLETVSVKQVKFDVESVKNFKIDDGECPDFPEDFLVPKYSLLDHGNGKVAKIVCVEAQIATLSRNKENEKVFRVTVSSKADNGKISCVVYPVTTVTDLTKCYEALVRKFMSDGFRRTPGVLATEFKDIVSEPLGLFLSEMRCLSGIIHPEVVRLVESVWIDSMGELKSHLRDDPGKIALDQVRNAMIALIKIEEALKNKTYAEDMSMEFYRYIPPKNDEDKTPIDTIQKVAKKREVCQLLKDVVSANEITCFGRTLPSTLSQYISLKCAIIWVNPQGREFKNVRDLLPESNENFKYKIHNIFKVSRTTENVELRRDLGNQKMLFHASAATNFVGILSRGLLMPFTASSELGIPRHDEGKLGSGIYFSDSFELSSVFTTTSQARGTRLMLINEVMLGEIFETEEPKVDLLAPPEGYQSVKGIGVTRKGASEYAIYNSSQQRMKYVIEFTLNDELVTPHSTKPCTLPSVNEAGKKEVMRGTHQENMDPKLKEMQYGLILDGKGVSAKLEEFHIRAKIVDLVSEVTVFQSYKNLSKNEVEAKYVFPLADNAAVCGFEAFINEKHVVGVVKEKEEAHREYKKAVAEGHGAYLMDEEKPNVFTVSIGNVPPNASVVVKIMYIGELETVNEPESCILFSVPENITKWQKDELLLSSSATQSTTDSTTVSREKKSSFMASIDMPFDILDVKCPSHKIVLKKTATKACVKLQKREVLGDRDFRLLIKVAEIHVPRIWIETDDAENNSDQVAMVTFFPEFDFDARENFDCTVLLDTSNSMSGSAASYLKYIAPLLIDSLPDKSRFNVMTFGSRNFESFVGFENSTLDSKVRAKKFVEEQSPGGGSDLLQILDSFGLLLEDKKIETAHNIFLLSDGHLSEEDRVLRLASGISKKSHSQTRIFCFGIGSSINSHLLQSLSLLTGGNYEHFSPSTKNTWKVQLQKQITFASQPALTEVNIDWCNYESTEIPQDTIVNVPEKIKCVFSGSRLTAYSFLPGCTKVTLSAKVNGKEFSTTIMAHSLSYVKGKMLHRLAAKAIFKEYESGRLAEDGYVDQVVRDRRKSSIINLSIKHSVISKFTSFIAIEKRVKNEDMSVTSGPLVSELVELAFTDNIPQVGWEVEEMTVEENIDRLLRRSAQLQTSSILQARELALEAKVLCDGLSEPDEMRELQVYAALSRVNAEGFDIQNVLKKVFKTGGSTPNYAMINSISRSEDPLVADAIEELASRSWPDYCSVQLSSIPCKLRPLAVALFITCHDNFGRNSIPFIDDGQTIAFFWEQLRGIDAGDGDYVSGDIMKQSRHIVYQMNRILGIKERTRMKEEVERLRNLPRKSKFVNSSTNSIPTPRRSVGCKALSMTYSSAFARKSKSSAKGYLSLKQGRISKPEGHDMNLSGIDPSPPFMEPADISSVASIPQNFFSVKTRQQSQLLHLFGSQTPQQLSGFGSTRQSGLFGATSVAAVSADDITGHIQPREPLPPPPWSGGGILPKPSRSSADLQSNSYFGFSLGQMKRRPMVRLPQSATPLRNFEASNLYDDLYGTTFAESGDSKKLLPPQDYMAPTYDSTASGCEDVDVYEDTSSHAESGDDTKRPPLPPAPPIPTLQTQQTSSFSVPQSKLRGFFYEGKKESGSVFTSTLSASTQRRRLLKSDSLSPTRLAEPPPAPSTVRSKDLSLDSKIAGSTRPALESFAMMTNVGEPFKNVSRKKKRNTEWVDSLDCALYEVPLATDSFDSTSSADDGTSTEEYASYSNDSESSWDSFSMCLRSVKPRDPKACIRFLAELVDSPNNESFFSTIRGDEYCEFPSDEEIAKEENKELTITKVLKICKRIVISAGGRSLGQSCLAMALNMLLTAILIEIMEVGINKMEEVDIIRYKNWLKRADAKEPMLYRRLELGFSWESAACSVAKKIVEEIPQQIFEVYL